jgi:hypothetical protein
MEAMPERERASSRNLEEDVSWMTVRNLLNGMITCKLRLRKN